MINFESHMLIVDGGGMRAIKIIHCPAFRSGRGPHSHTAC
jgi:hypothetical protein